MADELGQLQSRLESLRQEYERYFMGLEKRPPHVEKGRVVRAIKYFDPGSNSVQKFKHRNLVQRLLTLEQYWGRIERAMEAGTYHREVARADYREKVAQRTPIEQRGQRRQTGKGPSRRERTSSAVGQAADDFLKTLGGDSSGPKRPKISMRGTKKSDSKNGDEG